MLLHLGIAGRAAGGGFSVASPLDFAGLLLAGLPLALASAFGGQVVAVPVARWTGRERDAETFALIAAAISGVAVVCRTAWPYTPPDIRTGILAGPPVGLLVWWLARRMLLRSSAGAACGMSTPKSFLDIA